MSEPPQGNTVKPEEVQPQGTGSGLDADTVDGSESADLGGGSNFQQDLQGNVYVQNSPTYQRTATVSGTNEVISVFYAYTDSSPRPLNNLTVTTQPGTTDSSFTFRGYVTVYCPSTADNMTSYSLKMFKNGSLKITQTGSTTCNTSKNYASAFNNTAITPDDTLTFSVSQASLGASVKAYFTALVYSGTGYGTTTTTATTTAVPSTDRAPIWFATNYTYGGVTGGAGRTPFGYQVRQNASVSFSTGGSSFFTTPYLAPSWSTGSPVNINFNNLSGVKEGWSAKGTLTGYEGVYA